MGEVRDVVLGVEPTRGAGRRGSEVPVVAHDLARFVRRLFERRLEGHRIVAGIRAVVPRDFERLAALHGRPGVSGDDRHATKGIEVSRRRTVLDLHDLLHARHFERLGSVEARYLAAVHGGTRHDGVQHPVEPGVDAVLGLAAHDVAAVDQL